ncbi:hypothetical protein TNCV_2479771 [Trichonephila clavipes]|nr:hypothetical protein TNCV_2479771 [Trichonephila clavipes]
MENQLVPLKDPNTKPLDWPMGRILEVFPVVMVFLDSHCAASATDEQKEKQIMMRFCGEFFYQMKDACEEHLDYRRLNRKYRVLTHLHLSPCSSYRNNLFPPFDFQAIVGVEG